MNSTTRILRLDASANPGLSGSRRLGDELLARLQRQYPASEIRRRDLNQQAQFIDAGWISANLSAADERDEAARQRLGASDELIAELQWADHIVLTTPMYNFSVPATLKAWIDQVCRAGITFRYTSDGPVGLLAGKRADIVITTGGVPLGSAADFLSGYLRQIFGFIGIEEVNIFAADRMKLDSATSVERALAQIDASYPAVAA
jgi:FMN-dependent NADH-azoreductase